jgi:lysophospholipase L1-like esterase
MGDVIRREPIEWSETWVEDANEEKLPRLLLIGDSITKSYYEQVSKALSGKLSCAKLATSRCIADPILCDELSLFLKQYSFSIIQFNNGLHGMDNPDEIYQQCFPKVFDFLRSMAPGAKFIWASTTPWRCEGKTHNLHKNNERVILRNRIAQDYVTSENLPTSDLYELLIGHPEYHSEDGVHLQEAGMHVVAEKTIDMIRDRMAGLL